MLIGPLIVFVLIFAFIAATSLRIVPDGQVFLKQRLGREVGELAPGLHFIMPFIEQTVRISTAPELKSIQHGRITLAITYQIKDPALLRRSAGDFDSALKVGSSTCLKKLLGEDLAKVSSIDVSRIEAQFSRDMADLFGPWGVTIDKVTLATKS